jgi:hypothetical protein
MEQELQNHWENLITPLLKDVASLEFRLRGKNFEAEISWVINTDPSRPKKPSKTLRIIFPWETIIEYQGKPESWQKSADKKIIKLIKKNLENFELDHDNPRSAAAPMVEWVISTDVIY